MTSGCIDRANINVHTLSSVANYVLGGDWDKWVYRQCTESQLLVDEDMTEPLVSRPSVHCIADYFVSILLLSVTCIKYITGNL